MKIAQKIQIIVLFVFFIPLITLAQGSSVYTDTLSNRHTTNNIQNYEKMWKKSLWFRMNLRTKVNEGFFANNHELPRILIEAVKNDLILPYKNDSLNTRISKEEFLANLRMPQVDLEDELDNDDDEWGEAVVAPSNGSNSNEYDPRDMYFIELKVERVFDKRRSRMYNDIIAVTIVLPAEYTRKKVEKDIATFSFKELNEQVFHINQKENPEAIWYNPQNTAQHRNLSDAFTLGLYDGRLIKYENPRGNSIIDLHGSGKKGFYKSMDAVYKLMEYEAMLWEY